MTDRKNLYILDDLLILSSYVILGVFLWLLRDFYPLLPSLIDDEVMRREVLVYLINDKGILLGVLLFSGIYNQILGRWIRRREQRTLAIIDQIMLYKTISLNSLSREAGISEERTKKLVKEIQGRGFLPITFDGLQVQMEESAPKGNPSSVKPPKGFSLGLFVFLFFFFWPAALIYGAKFYNDLKEKQFVKENWQGEED